MVPTEPCRCNPVGTNKKKRLRSINRQSFETHRFRFAKSERMAIIDDDDREASQIHRPHLAEESVPKMKTIQKSKLIVFLKGEPGAPRPFVRVGPPGAMVQMHSIDNLNIVCRSNERYRIKIFVKPHINPQKPEPPSAKGSSLVSYFPFLFITFSKTIYVKPQIRPKPPVQKFHLDLFIYFFDYSFLAYHDKLLL